MWSNRKYVPLSLFLLLKMNTHRHTQTHTLHTAGLVYFNVKSEKVGASDHEDGLQSAGSRPGDQLTLSIRLKEPNTADESEDVRGSMMLLFLHSTALVWTFSFSIPAVSCLVNMKSSVGEDILLPCGHKDFSSVPQNVSFLWTDRQGKVLLVIIHNFPDIRPQHQTFRGRVTMFPALYRKGNFSIVLQNVQESDSNNYTCIVPRLDFQQHVRLTVSGESPERPWSSCFHMVLLVMCLFFWG
ncbi:uncharacterized protein [Trachinotus anak]|uniref:uncharacterized protein isoform X2 n=1 Tax=Trachinotus anak TaxID=443729 RepID=UPI0039F20090